MKRIIILLVLAMAFMGVVAQASEPIRGTKARVVPENMSFYCMVGETVTDTIYVYNLSSSNIYPVCGFNSSPGYIWTDAHFGTIPPGGVGKAVVTYTPESAGTHTASLSMNIGGEFYGVDMTGEAYEDPVIEMTATPYITSTVIKGGYLVEIFSTEPDDNVVFYYRISYDNMGDMSGEWSEWMEYTEPIFFNELGHYMVEAYAITPGKTESNSVMYDFMLTEPIPCYDFEENGIFYNITSNGKVCVTYENNSLNSYSGKVTIPNTVTHDGVTYMVTAIGEDAFRDCENLTAVTIGDYVTTISQMAFMNCPSLTSIVLGDYVITVEDYAFNCCSNLVSVTLGKGLRSLGRDVFGYCHSLTDVTCKAATPPVMGVESTFDSNIYQSATLHVYPPVIDSYKTTNYWRKFTYIVGEDTVNPLPSDVNGDGGVDIDDVSSLIGNLLGGN